MSYCLSPHDREVLERAYESRDWTDILMLLRLDRARQATRAQDDGFTPSERRRRDASPPFDRERDGG